jgi:hypothetical protein
LFELLESENRTKLIIEKKCDFAIIKYDVATEETSFYKKFEKHSSLDAKIEPFDNEDVRYFLVVYPHVHFQPGRDIR